MADAPEFVDFEVEADFEGTEAWGGGYQNLPPGKYILDVVNIQQDTSRKSNNATIKVTFAVAEGQETDEAAKQTGRKAFNSYSLSEKAIGRLKNFMLACGAPLDRFRASACMGAKIRATIIHSQGEADVGPDGTPRDAKTFANVVDEQPLDGGVQDAAPPPPPPVTRQKPAAAKTSGNSAQPTRRA